MFTFFSFLRTIQYNKHYSDVQYKTLGRVQHLQGQALNLKHVYTVLEMKFEFTGPNQILEFIFKYHSSK
jgi:hypothetical protein